jgi:L-fuconolactonase
MYKLDSHQHFWDKDAFPYPWLKPDNNNILYRNFTPPDLAPHLAETGVNGTIVVQATHHRGETEWFLKLAQQYEFIKGVVGWVDLTAYDIDEQLDRLIELGAGKLCGIRHQVHNEADPNWSVQPSVIRGLRILASKNLPFDLLFRPPHLKLLPELSRAVPEMRWVINHIAKPLIKDGVTEPWAEDMRQAAYLPNVYCKVSGMITEADHANWTVANIRPYFEQVLEFFKPNRLMWGSDWPVCTRAGTYRQVHDLMVELVAPLSENEQAAIWGKTAQEFYFREG